MKRLAVLIFCSFLFNIAKSQYYTTGEDPSRIKFDYFETPHFKVVFPRYAKTYALKLGAMLEQSYKYVQFNPNEVKTRKIAVLIHTKNSLSNGYVTWAPKRMELMALPPFQFSALSWDRDLSIHEFRHVSQISNLYKGVTGLSYYLLGEQGIGAMTSLVPLWFYEGDAVFAETAYTQAGRGRESDFLLPYKVRLAENCDLKFDQYLNGSFKTNIPNHYALGYLLNSYGRVNYNDNLWDSIMRFTTRNPYLFAAFSFGIKKYTKQTRKELFKSSLIFYDSLWNSFSSEPKTKENKRSRIKYQNYSYPIVINNKIYSFKSTLNRNTFLTARDSNGKETILKSVQNPNSQPSTDGNSILWTEYCTAGRWSQVVFSVINKYDIAKNSLTRISDLGYYSYPTFKGDTIVAFKYHDSNKISIGIYTGTFDKLKEIDLPFGQVKDLQCQGNMLYYTTLDSLDNMIVVKQDINTNTIYPTLNFGRKNIAALKVKASKLFFTSDFSGKSNLYQYDTISKNLTKVVNPQYGVDNYDFIDSINIATANYTINGYQIKIVSKSSEPCLDVKYAANGYPVADLLSSQVKVNLQDSININTEQKVNKYIKAKHLFNIHSWAPFYFDPVEIQNLDLNIYPGITVVSQNLLSTSFATLSYGYTPEGHIFDINYSYKGWLPVLNFKYNLYNTLPKVYRIKNHPYNLDSSTSRKRFVVSSYIPFHYKTGIWNFTLQPYVDYSRYNDILFNSKTNKYNTGFDQISTSIYFGVQSQQALQNIFPRWGANFFFKITSAPFEEENLGSLFAYRLGLIVPGILPNHGLMTRFFYQNQKLDKYYFSSAFPLPRGYNSSSFASQYYKMVAADYSFPLLYPDANLSWLVYIKRIRLNLFADFAENIRPSYVKKDNKYEQIHLYDFYSSVGSDILFDVNLLRSTFPITTGLRIAYNNDKTTYLNAIFSINFN